MTGAVDGIGGAATSGLLAREIALAREGAPAVGHSEHEACSNCGTVRCGPFCHQCGQAGHVHRTLGALVHDVAHGVFHIEGRIVHTVPLLAWHPGRLTRRYVEGERARFVSPMALFLFSVFLLFAVVSNLPGHGGVLPSVGSGAHGIDGDVAQARQKVSDLQQRRATVTDPERQAALDRQIVEGRKELSVLTRLRAAGIGRSEERDEDTGFKHLDRADVHTGMAWLDDLIIHATRNPELLLYKMKSYGYKYSWALIPISLPFLWLLFAFRRDVGLYDHAIFATYSLSFMSLAVVVLAVLGASGLPSALITMAAIVVPPVHMYRQLKGAYRLGRFGAGWRTVALLAITLVTSTLFLALLFYMGSE